MAYKICYSVETEHKFPTGTIRKRRKTWRIIILVSISIFYMIYLHKVTDTDRGRFYENAEFTCRELEAMVQDIRAGETAVDAFADFCADVIDHARTDS